VRHLRTPRTSGRGGGDGEGFWDVVFEPTSELRGLVTVAGDQVGQSRLGLYKGIGVPNRAELGAVLGEVMMLVEYRGRTVPLPYSQEPFSIPKNVVLLATMNTADRSLALVDFALRRRFHAIAMRPDREVLKASVGPEGSLATEMFDLVQSAVGDDDFAPGHSYWMAPNLSAEGLIQIWKYEIEPYLREYWFESKARLAELEQQVMSLLSSEGI